MNFTFINNGAMSIHKPLWAQKGEGVSQNSILLHKLYIVKMSIKRGGGQKCTKNCPHGLWMTPRRFLSKWCLFRKILKNITPSSQWEQQKIYYQNEMRSSFTYKCQYDVRFVFIVFLFCCAQLRKMKISISQKCLKKTQIVFSCLNQS